MPEEDEVTLYDYIKVVRKRKWLIVIGTCACILTAGLVSLSLPKTYEAVLDLRIGKVWGTPIADNHLVSQKLSSEALLVKVIEKLGPEISSQSLRGTLRTSVLPGGLVRLVARANTPPEAVKVVNAVATLVVEEHQDRYDRAMAPYYQYEKDLAGRIKKVESHISGMKATLSHLQKDPQTSAPAVILLQAQLEQKEAQLVGFVRELRDVNINNHSLMKSHMTQIENPPVEPESPVAPRKKRIVLIAGVLGGMVALFMAFFLEYLEKMREEESGSRRQEG